MRKTGVREGWWLHLNEHRMQWAEASPAVRQEHNYQRNLGILVSIERIGSWKTCAGVYTTSSTHATGPSAHCRQSSRRPHHSSTSSPRRPARLAATLAAVFLDLLDLHRKRGRRGAEADALREGAVGGVPVSGRRLVRGSLGTRLRGWLWDECSGGAARVACQRRGALVRRRHGGGRRRRGRAGRSLVSHGR